jgi:crossover junction endodeoxyribonuclease RuvC
MRLLALDMSTFVGWVRFDGPRRLAARGTWRNPAYGQGPRFNAFASWLNRALTEHPVDILAYEEPLRPMPGRKMFKTTLETQKLLQGFATVAEMMGARHRVARVVEVPLQLVKLQLSGNGRANKAAMVAAAIRMGVNVSSDHEADALGVALAAFEHAGVKVRGYDGPLLEPISRWS